MFKKRICKKESTTGGLKGCPDIWELNDGNYAVIGLRKTSIVGNHLPDDVTIGPDEELVILPKEVLKSIKNNI